MADPDIEAIPHEGADVAEELNEPDRRGRLLIGAILLLLLLLCTISTVVETYVERGEQTIRQVTRNLTCLQCHVELIPMMSWPTVHDPFGNEQCTSCHTPHGEIVERSIFEEVGEAYQRIRTLVEWLPLKIVLDVFDTGEDSTEPGVKEVLTEALTARVKGETSELVLPRDELCWLCHGGLGEQLGWEYPHEPFEQGECIGCHNPHATQTRRLLVVETRDLCVLCHQLGDELNRMQAHPPAAERRCLDCHGYHATRWKGMLVSRQRELCFSCHSGPARQSLMSVQHQPYTYDNCTGCHEPHGSDDLPLLVESPPRLCYGCHPETRLDFLKPSHHPVGTVKLNCVDCHHPHASDNRVLLAAVDNEVCFKCHDVVPVRVTYDISAHYDTLCIRCHTPHGSNWGPLLQQRNPELCLQCHEPIYFDEESGNNHPMRPYHFDVARRQPLTCTSTCHNPHGTDLNFMLKKYEFPKDGGCLQCHAVIPGDRVGVDF